MTIPSKTWMRRRWPSITWKWTRTVSPALKTGIPSRSWRSSMTSIGFGMRAGRRSRRRILAKADSLGRPVDGEDLADEAVPRDGSPHPAVAGRRPVVAHHEVLALGNAPCPDVVRVLPLPLRVEIALVEPLAVQVDDAPSVLPDRVARKADQTLDEDAARAAAHLLGLLRHVEHD